MSIRDGAASSPRARLLVLILSPHPSVHGGVTAFIETMKPHLVQCDIIPFYVGSAQDDKEGAFSKLCRLICAPFAIVSLVRKEKPDVVHINPSLEPKSVLRDGLILLALRLAGFRRTLVYMHGWRVPVEKRIRSTPGICQLTRWLLNGAGHIMVLAPEFKQGLEAMGVKGEHITFTRTMFDGAPIKAVQNITATPARRSILFMSRFERAKGVYELLEAFARIAPRHADVDLIYAGDGAEMQGLRQKVAELKLEPRVIFTGYIHGKEKAALLCSCTVYTLPTYFSEGMPVALLEAMGAGKVLLTSMAGGIRHIVSDPDNGVVLERVTTDTVEAGLIRLLTDEAYCKQTGEHNRVRAWEHFEAAQVTAEIEAMYNRIAKL